MVVKGDDRHLEQVRKQLEKLIPVVKVHDISREDYVERDLMLIKLKVPAADGRKSSRWCRSSGAGSSTSVPRSS